ncbi:class I SAM-dependent methyltransferase [Pseudoteredinibacter isoporae]|uniref:O-methyltransferase involved in polyketide biosynthesis n=1 Tax=Pseudoteredinibacter isoporae TaxID=570281 RepID=A0A7X0JWN5_9GAMM|nr:class I SAM-dependent methyltransferase [Pseudoteredinibacter isoporae]MBB6523610.1 O-methyltransferase involved in polyketide biosynthesis [Pseudoteredinibacter isoporae]NHO89117.1 class I SAM-dependent methyltransferase [Pseudoteredinibacter isoporae]NIB22272.1 class I SAM-dependent methyltransferase [Pseudoteredinibacter isoporae]
MQTLNDIPKTLLIPLWARGHATVNNIEECQDTFAAKLLLDESVDFADLDKMPLSYQSMMFHGVATRTRLFDEEIKTFIAKHDYPVIINLGCGLDYRSYRLGDHKVSWYNVDVKDTHSLRRDFLEAKENSHELIGGIDDFSWFEQIKLHPEQSLLLISEGTFMYFEETVVENFLKAFSAHFPKHQACIEVIGDQAKGKVHPSVKAVGANSPFRHGMRNPRKSIQSYLPDADIQKVQNLFDDGSKLLWWLKVLFFVNPQLKYRLGSVLVSYQQPGE